MRAFIALDLDPAFVSDVAALARRLEPTMKGRFLARETYHLTLAFLGEIGEREAADAAWAVDEACRRARPVALASEGLGKFGRAGDATLWLGIAPDSALSNLADNLRAHLATRGVPFDAKPFRPHITLARRVRIPAAPLPALAFPQNGTAPSVTLFKSTLDRAGAVYKPLHSALLPTRR
ncbi:RNA 2',3'-cyclic phosphodiesterase [Rubneribacter sp.]